MCSICCLYERLRYCLGLRRNCPHVVMIGHSTVDWEHLAHSIWHLPSPKVDFSPLLCTTFFTLSFTTRVWAVGLYWRVKRNDERAQRPECTIGEFFDRTLIAFQPGQHCGLFLMADGDGWIGLYILLCTFFSSTLFLYCLHLAAPSSSSKLPQASMLVMRSFYISTINNQCCHERPANSLKLHVRSIFCDHV